MRLLLFNFATDADNPFWGFATRWIQALAARVDHMHVISMRTGRVDVPQNVSVHSMGAEKGYSELRRAVEFYRHLWKVLQQDRVDACFSHMILVLPVMAGPILKVRNIPLVTWFAHRHLPRMLKAAHYFSDRVVSSIPTAYPYMHDKLHTVGAGIDTNLFVPDGTAPDDLSLILCVGRLSAVKDHPTLLRAAALLQSRVTRPFRIVVIGGPARAEDGPYVRSVHDLAAELGLGDIVEFLGPVPVAELPRWYRRCTLHVNLTPTGFGDKVALEAMACGRLSVVANTGFRETLGDCADALIFPWGDPVRLADTLHSLLTLRADQRARIEQRLRANVEAVHSLNAVADRIVELLEGLSRARRQ